VPFLKLVRKPRQCSLTFHTKPFDVVERDAIGRRRQRCISELKKKVTARRKDEHHLKRAFLGERLKWQDEKEDHSLQKQLSAAYSFPFALTSRDVGHSTFHTTGTRPFPSLHPFGPEEF
jgi:hypothetical protein